MAYGRESHFLTLFSLFIASLRFSLTRDYSTGMDGDLKLFIVISAQNKPKYSQKWQRTVKRSFGSGAHGTLPSYSGSIM